MTDVNIFEVATRKKLRFSTASGEVTTEDLWDLPLTGKRANLDDLAKSLYRQIKEQEETSFVVQKSRASEVAELKFNVVKHVIDVKLAEREAAREEVARREHKQKIMEAIAEKKEEGIKSKSLEELEAELAKL